MLQILRLLILIHKEIMKPIILELIQMLQILIQAIVQTLTILIQVAILLLIPLLTPMLDFYGISPIYYAAVVLLVLEFGNVTPPFCASLFMAAKLTGVPFTAIFKKTLPFLIINYVVLLVVLFFPGTTTFLVG